MHPSLLIPHTPGWWLGGAFDANNITPQAENKLNYKIIAFIKLMG